MSFVLIIEDQPLHAKLFADVLRIAGFSSATALTGNDGIAVATAAKPDLIVVDILLPDQLGYEVISTLRNSAENTSVPIIAMTAASEGDFETLSIEAGANVFLQKPVPISRFSAEVVRLLEGSDRRALV